MKISCIVLVLATAHVLIPATPRDDDAAAQRDREVSATSTWLAALDEESRSIATFPFDSPERRNWHFVPRERKGLALAEMSATERAATQRFLRSLLPPLGYQVVERIRSLEDVLREIEGSDHRDPLRYHVSVFGTPAPDHPFGIRYEGHHVSINLTRVDGASSRLPFFLGANPAEIRSGPREGESALGSFTFLLMSLLRSLTDEQRAVARLEGPMPQDVISIPGEPVVPYASGLPLSDLLALQNEDLVALCLMLSSFGAITPEEAGTPALGEGRLAYSGSLEDGDPLYFRVGLERWFDEEATGLVIEFANVQNGANHVHLLVRDPDDDFGARILAEHLAAESPSEDDEH